MPTNERRRVTLPPDLAALVDDAVASGEFGNDSEVISEALRRWQDSREQRGYTVEELRALWQEGLDSGEPQPFTAETMKEVRAAGQKRLAERQGRA